MPEERKRLAYKQIGERESELSLVFLHGSAMTKEGMLPVVKGFTKYNCIVFDLTAHGESAGEEPGDIQTFAEDVEYSVEQLQQEKVIGEKIVLLGYSMGGAITCEIAIRKKLQLSGMVLLSSGADLNSYTPLVDELKNMPVEKFRVEEVFPCLFGSDTPQDEQQTIMEIFNSTKVSDEISYGDLMVSNRYNRLKECKNIDIPTFIVQGNDDKIVLPMAALETWKMIPKSELLMVPYKGHAAMIEDKDVVGEKISVFLGKIIEA